MRFTLIFLTLSLLFPNFKLNIDNSSISYTGSHPFHDWQGITSQIEIITDCDMVSSDCGATINVPVMSFISGNDNRDSNMLFYVDGFSFPIIKISFSHLNISNLLSREETVNLGGEIDFHGFKVMQQIPLFITQEENTIFINSEFLIKLDSFEVDRPSLLMVPIKNEIKIDVNISGEFTQ
jgi:hypothetical protein